MGTVVPRSRVFLTGGRPSTRDGVEHANTTYAVAKSIAVPRCEEFLVGVPAPARRGSAHGDLVRCRSDCPGRCVSQLR